MFYYFTSQFEENANRKQVATFSILCFSLSPPTYPAGKKFYPVLSYGCASENAGISRNG
jgi:hypothetical protein